MGIETKTTTLVGCATTTKFDYNSYVNTGKTERKKQLIAARKSIDACDELLIVGPHFDLPQRIKSPIEGLIAYALSQNKIVTYTH